MAGCAILLKPSGGAALLLGVLWLGYRKAHYREWLILLGGSAVPLACALAHGAWTVGLNTYLDATILFRLKHPVEDQVWRFLAGTLLTGVVTTPLALGAALAFRAVPTASRVFWVLWVASSFVGVASGGNWWTHYYIQLVPPLAATTGLAIASRAQYRPAGRAFCALLPLVYLIPLALMASFPGATRTTGLPALEYADEAGQFMRGVTAPSDRILVWYSEPSINYYADRLPVVPWLYPQQIEEVDGAYDRLLTAVRQRDPALIAVVTDGRRTRVDSGRFFNALDANYRPLQEFPYIVVYAPIATQREAPPRAP
jgi:hypothetical protein